MDKKIDAILSFIQDNYTKKITLKKISEICDTNYCYLSSVFKKKTGVSFSKYVKSLKMESAKNLLKEGLFEIKEIPQKIGYKSLTHFYKDFKFLVGMPPKEYRKINGECIAQNYLEKLQNKTNISK